MNTRYTLFGRILAICYGLASVLLFVYSYTQVDLGLTLTSVSIWQSIQKWFQHIGYFNRPLSTGIYLGILAVFFSLYIVTIIAIHKKRLTSKDLWLIIGTVVVGTVLSYPAFSYDLFNHMFTAKTVLIYHKNPYEVIPLQFAGVDPWLAFMHWTHVRSIYSPLWILATLPPYFFGFGYLLLIMWNFKVLLAASYILAVWAIGKILELDRSEKRLFGMAVFALNPLVIIESLVSAHNDILMMALAVLAIYLFSKKGKIASLFVLSLSIATKLMTICLLPVWLLGWKRWMAFLAMCVGLFAFLTQREIMSWYFLWILPFVALLPDIQILTVISGGVSLGLLLRYAPFLYYGHWNDPVPAMKLWTTYVPIAVSIVLSLILYLLKRKKATHQFS
ncbi:MAG: glycosyltransferase family 87 protein [Candidatus Gottesmanbacteria bacterium]